MALPKEVEVIEDVDRFERRSPGTLPAVQDNSQALVELAMRTGDLDKLQKAMELQERWEANEARKAYHEAMTAFKANPPEISKDKHVAYKDVKYSHASLANVCDKIGKVLSAHGLSAAWKTSQETGITVTCTITHRGGHSESTSLTAAADNTGSKNSIQAIGSTISYLERYTLLALTGLATHDQDDDAKEAEVSPDYLNADQVTEINDLIKETGAKEKLFLKWCNAESVEMILAKSYPIVKAELDKKKAKLRQPGE